MQANTLCAFVVIQTGINLTWYENRFYSSSQLEKTRLYKKDEFFRQGNNVCMHELDEEEEKEQAGGE